MTTLAIQVSAANDDVRVGKASGVWTLDNQPYVFTGYWTSVNTNYGGGYRFLNVTIPQGATINSAYLTFNAYDSRSLNTVNSRIVGDLENNCATFSTIADYQSRRGTDAGGANNTKRTTASVLWDAIGAWTANSNYNSPDISTIIQEIVNQAGWASGNALALFWDDHEARGTQGTQFVVRLPNTYEAGTTLGAILHVDYTSASVPTVMTPTSASITATSATLGANVTADGGSSITARGTVWGTSATPTGNALAEGGTTTGVFTHSRISLPSSTLIYFRGYATNSIGTGYSADGTFTTLTPPAISLRNIKMWNVKIS